MIHENYQRYSNYTTVIQSREVPVEVDCPWKANFAIVTLCSQSLRNNFYCLVLCLLQLFRLDGKVNKALPEYPVS